MPTPTLRRSLVERSRPLRWAVAVVLVVAGLVAIIAGWVEVCGPSGCRSPAVTDAVTVGWALLLVLLLSPDLSEAGIAGLFTLRTRVGVLDDRLDGLDARLSARLSQLTSQVSAVRQAANAVGGGAVVNVVSGTATGAFAAAGTGAPGEADTSSGAGASARPPPQVRASTSAAPGGDADAAPGGAVGAPGEDARRGRDAPPSPGEDARTVGGGRPGPAPGVASVARDQGRYVAGELLMAHLGDLGSGSLEAANLRLYLPTEDGERLLPVLHLPGGHADEDVWRLGEGAVGRAWNEVATIVLRDDDVMAAVADLPAERRRRYERLRAVVALPVLNAVGEPVAVLSASSQDPASSLPESEVLEDLVAAAEVVARILIDLLGWATDTSASIPGGAQ